MNGLKRYSIIVITLAIATMISIGFFSSNNAEAKKIYSGSVKTKVTLHSATLKWSVSKKAKKKVDYYVIYKKKVTKAYKKTIKKNRESIKLPSDSKYKKIKKVSKNVRTFTNNKLKKNQCYSFFVKGFKKKKGKDTLVYQSKKGNAVTGVVPAYIFEWLEDFLHITQDSATFEYYDTPISRTRGLKIYRIDLLVKVKGGKYKKKSSLNKKQIYDKYDQYLLSAKKLKRGKKYYFKAKSYAKINGKKLTKTSSPLVYRIVNDNAKIKVKSMTKPGVTDNAILKITSKSKYNGTICFSKKYEDIESQDYSAKSKDGKTKVKSNFRIVMYSRDNKKWHKLTSKVVKLKPKKSIYIKVEFVDDIGKGQEYSLGKVKINYMGSNAKKSEFYIDETWADAYRGNSRNADWCVMIWDLVNQKNYCYIDIEGT